MFPINNYTRPFFTRLERAVAAVEKKDLAEGKEQNPLSAMHWTLETSGPLDHRGNASGYKITMMRAGLVVSQKTVDAKEIEKSEDVEALVRAMFAKVPASKAA